MKKVSLAAALLAAATTAPAQPLGYPGVVWGTIVYAPTARHGEPTFQTQGIVEQGIDWFRFGNDKWKFNTYGAVTYVIDDNNTTFVPQLGMKVNRRFENGSLDLGLRVMSENKVVSGSPLVTSSHSERKATVQLYATYWFDWNLRRAP